LFVSAFISELRVLTVEMVLKDGHALTSTGRFPLIECVGMLISQ
jgi:hypothetical protein